MTKNKNQNVFVALTLAQFFIVRVCFTLICKPKIIKTKRYLFKEMFLEKNVIEQVLLHKTLVYIFSNRQQPVTLEDIPTRGITGKNIIRDTLLDDGNSINIIL